MSKRLSGLNPLAYIGVEPSEPSNMYMSPLAPTPTDVRNVNIGDFWIDTVTETLYVLVSQAGGVAAWVQLSSGGGTFTNVTITGTLTVGGMTTLNGGLTLGGFTNGVLTVNNSGVVGEVTTTNHSLLVGNSSGTITSLPVMTDGQIPIGVTGSNPVPGNITAGSGITVTNGPGSIQIAATGSGSGAVTFHTNGADATVAANAISLLGAGGITTSGSGSTVTITGGGGGSGITWNVITSGPVSMVVNNGYIINSGSLVTLTLPATAAVGDFLYVTGLGAGGWSVAQGAGQIIRFGALSTTLGAGGSLSSTNQYNNLTMVCVVANTTYCVISSQGNITVV